MITLHQHPGLPNGIFISATRLRNPGIKARNNSISRRLNIMTRLQDGWREETHPNVLAIDKKLWHLYGCTSDPVSELGLRLRGHVHVPFLVLDHVCPEYLLNQYATVVRLPYNAHRGRVNDNFSRILCLVVLKHGKSKTSLFFYFFFIYHV